MPSQNDEDKPQSSGLPVFNRLARAGSGGLAAATVGWTLAICVVGGALAGLALDKRLGTGYWTPILLLVGVAVGFIQMVRTLNDANRWEEQQRKAERRDVIAAGQSATTGVERSGSTKTVTSSTPVPSRGARVPAPPTASFAKSVSDEKPVTDTRGVASPELPSDVADDLAQLRQMLQEQRTEGDTKGDAEDDEAGRKAREG